MSKRERIDTTGRSSYIRRDANGHFTSAQVDVGRSLSADNNQKSKKPNPGGQGDRGDGRKTK